MKREREAITRLIRDQDTFLITSHINPDGDSIAAQLALRHILLSCGKSCTVVNRHPVPRIYRFLPGAEKILIRQRLSTHPYSTAFVLDCGNLSRLNGLMDGRRPPTVVNIDHHVTNTKFGDLNLVVPEASSTCEVIYDVARWLGIEIDHNVACNLYAGILTDTGSFRYSSTTPRSMSVAGRLLRYGVDPHYVAEKIYESAEYSSLRLLGKVLSRIKRSTDGRISWVTFSHTELSSISDAAETEEFVNYARSLNTARLAVAFKEICPGNIRISFRSKGKTNVAELASRYNGGGHRNAAGCTVVGNLKGVEKKIIEAARRFLDEPQSTTL